MFGFYCNQSYTSCPDGFDPTLPPVQLGGRQPICRTWWAGLGNANAGGTIFRTATLGQAFVIHTFQSASLGGGFPNGNHPVIGLNQGTDGNLYGVTENGGTHDDGVMYKLSRTGSFQVLYNFCSLSGCPDGPGPLTLASDGNFYGGEFHTISASRRRVTGAWFTRLIPPPKASPAPSFELPTETSMAPAGSMTRAPSFE